MTAAAQRYLREYCAAVICGIFPGEAPGSGGATQHASRPNGPGWLTADTDPLPPAPVLLQSHEGRFPSFSTRGSASHSEGG